MEIDIKKLMTAIIGAAVGLIILASLLVPVLSIYTKTTDTFTNESYYCMDKIGNSTDITITWKIADPSVVNVNGTNIDMSGFPTGRGYTLVGSDSLIVRYTVVGGGVVYIEMLGDYYTQINSTVSDATKATITVSGMTVTYLDDRTSPVTHTYNITGDSYCIIPGDGPYTEIMKDGSVPAYVLADTEIYLIGTTLANPTIGVYGYGSIDDGITLETAYKPNSVTTVSYSNVVTTATAVNNYKDLYSLEKFEFTIDYDGNTMDSTYTYFVVPAKVTAERAYHFNATEIDLLNIAPMLLIIAIALGLLFPMLRNRE